MARRRYTPKLKAQVALVSGARVTNLFAAQGPDAKYVRDCQGRIVARSYASEESTDMRRRTESNTI